METHGITGEKLYMAYQNEKVKARQVVTQNTQTKELGIVSEVPMGEWNATTQYQKLNKVRYVFSGGGGVVLLAKKQSQNIEPFVTTGWQEVWMVENYDGKGVSSTIITYQAGTSAQTPPVGNWSVNIPIVEQGQYLWTRTVFTFTDGQTLTSYNVSYQPLDGNSITSTIIDYQSGISGTETPTGEWVSNVPEVPQGQYLWTRVTFNFSKSNPVSAYSVSLQGLNFTRQDRIDIEKIIDVIPSSASKDNPLATKNFVNSSINNLAAFYITYNASGDAFSTSTSLRTATKFYSGGQDRVPTQNDYAIVLADESQPKGVDGSYPTTRYSYQGGTYPDGQWDFQYIVNNTSLTQAQVDAINSGITSELVESIPNKVNKSGDTMTGDLSFTAGNIKFPNDCPENSTPAYFVTFVANDAANGLAFTRTANMPYVIKSGDTMTGNLWISTGSYPAVILQESAQKYKGYFELANNELDLIYRDSNDNNLSYIGLANGYINAHGEFQENGQRVYSPNNKPTPAAIGALNKSGDTMNGALQLNSSLLSKNGDNPVYILPYIPYAQIDPTHDTATYLKALLKWICQNYSNVTGGTWIGRVNPNSSGTAIIEIYDTNKVNSDGLPEYSTGTYRNLSYEIITFGTNSYGFAMYNIGPQSSGNVSDMFRHNITISTMSSSNQRLATLTIINSLNSEFSNFSELAQWFYNNGYNDTYKCYSATGAVFYNTSAYTIVGMFSSRGDTIKAVPSNNWSSLDSQYFNSAAITDYIEKIM